MVDIVLEELLQCLGGVDFEQDVLCGLQHLDDGGMDGLFASQEEEVKHHLAELLRGVVVAHH